jgi:hypothetical protein
MKQICVQFQPDRAPGLSMTEVRSVLERIAATPRLVQSHRVDDLTFIFETPDLGELWRLIEAEIFGDPPWGRLARKASIVTCDGLILHHFDPSVARASPPENKRTKNPRCG